MAQWSGLGRLGFGDCVLDLAAHELRREGQVVPVEPQVFDVLAYLVEHRDRMVPKTELLDEVWGDRFVSESALTSRIKAARRAVGDNGRDQRVIRTVHGRGYRFVAPVDGEARRPPGEPGDPHDALARLEAGHGSVLAVVGPPGGARTDLLEDLYDAAAAAGLLVGQGSAGGLRPVAAVLDAVDELLHRAPALTDRMPEACAAELGAVLDGAPPTTWGRLQLCLREAVVAAAEAGAVLVLHDLELADGETLDLVRLLARLTRRHRVLLVVGHGAGLDLGADVAHHVVEPPAADGERPGSALPAEVADALRRVALSGATFDRRTLQAATGLDPAALDRILDVALRAGVLEGATNGYRFGSPEEAERLAAELGPNRRDEVHRQTARALAEVGGPAEDVARHLLAAGDAAAAVRPGVEAVRRLAAAQRHRQVREWVDALVDHAEGRERVELLALRAAALVAAGDPGAVTAYREALATAEPDQVVPLRAGLAQAAVLDGDVATAEEAIAGLEPDGGPYDGAILLVRGMLAFLRSEYDEAERAAGAVRELALAPGAPNRLLDAITLEGMIAHDRGQWFDRLRRELRATRDQPELASTVFDSHLCVAEYLLYGPTPYDEVVGLARELQRTAHDSGARRAEGFALCVAGEAELLAGELEAARADLEAAVDLHRDLGAGTGTAHALQRLAEVALAEGDRAEAERLARQALPLARWSPLSRHLLQRTYGTLVAAAPDLDAALAVVEDSVASLDEPARCEICDVMIAVPAAATYAEAGRLDEAREALARAERSAAFWHGTAWQAAVAEARAVLRRAEGEPGEAEQLLRRAAVLFDQAGQPLDAARCREASES